MYLTELFYIKFVKTISIKKLKYLFLAALLSPFIFVIFLIKPLLLIRFGYFDTPKIGTFSTIEHYLLHQSGKKKDQRIFDVWVVDPIVCNKQFLKILKRNFFIIQNFYFFYDLINFFSKYLKFLSKHIIPLYNFPSRIDRGGCKLKLTDLEIESGKIMLKKFGIPEKAKIICISTRDSLYKKKVYPSENFSYHNYRNTKFINYIPAIKELIKKNFYVIRMGNIAEKKMNIQSKKFIDYPFHPFKNDLMDFFFAYKCYFWICSNTGLDEIAVAFRKPLLDLNMAPISTCKITSKKTIIYGKIYKNYNNKKLSLAEIFDKGAATYFRSDQYRKSKIKLEELSKNDIKEAVLEMLKMLKNSWKLKNKSEIKLQEKFKKIFIEKIVNIDTTFNKFKVNAFYSSRFLKKNPWFLK